jgi:hypothetical protein
MASTNVYRLHFPLLQRIIVFGTMGIMSIVGVGLIVAAALNRLGGMPVPFLLFWLAALGWNWYVLVGIPYEIRFEPGDRLSFKSLARTATLNASEIKSIKPYGGGFGSGPLFILRHDGGKIRLVAQFTGFHEVVSRIKTAHPGIEVIGI